MAAADGYHEAGCVLTAEATLNSTAAMRTTTRLTVLWPLLLVSCAGPMKCPFAGHHRPSSNSCTHGECLAKHDSARSKDSISRSDREYYEALDRRTAIQEDLSANRATARKSGMTPALQRAINEERRELRAIEYKIEAMDARRTGTEGAPR
jgi:hypothetical protein